MSKVILPEPVFKGRVSVEEAIYNRISRRSFKAGRLNLAQVGQLLWAAGGLGVGGDAGVSRSAPSAGATYPVELYLVAGEVEELGPGCYYYDYREHRLKLMQKGDLRAQLAEASLGQQMVARAPMSMIMSACYERTSRRYGDRGYRYVFMEIGYLSQNVYLQAEALNLSTVAVGAFDDERVKQILAIKEAPLMIMPVGHRR
ncbi:MAG TPA: SagB/ThcOx family dehydrogenase [Firmicutes bacterium]|nr:SagB/ThcOx family dehydrogenase [Bacillota bacterium]